MRLLKLGLICGLVAGCPADDPAQASGTDGSSSGEESDDGPSTTSPTTTPTTTPTTETTLGSSSDGSTSISTITGPDETSSTGTGGTTGTTTVADGTTTTGAACRPVDLVLVVDNSGSMLDEQAKLADISIPLAEGLLPLDPHAMVVDVDAWSQQACADACEQGCAIGEPTCANGGALCFAYCTICDGFTCGDEAAACDVLGGGIDFPQGQDASNEDCEFSSGGRYIDDSQADFAAALACASQVGTGSTAPYEYTAAAMIAAVSGADPAASCNEGFLRDEALLAVLFVTDEDDDPVDGSNGTPAGWRQALLAAKGGDASSVVMLGIMPGAVPSPSCVLKKTKVVPSPRLEALVDTFGALGLQGDSCAPGYVDEIDAFLELIEAQACAR